MDLNDATWAWSKRFQQRHPRKNMPNDQQMGVYSAVLHYLKAVDKLSPLERPLAGCGRDHAIALVGE